MRLPPLLVCSRPNARFPRLPNFKALADKTAFPAFAQLPWEIQGRVERRGRGYRAVLKPQWCFLGEILTNRKGRPASTHGMLEVVDRDKNQVVVFLGGAGAHKRLRSPDDSLWPADKVSGSWPRRTIAIMLATKERLVDEVDGVQVSDAAELRVIPLSMGDILDLSTKQSKSSQREALGQCSVCKRKPQQGEHLKKCGQCRLRNYCSKDCQHVDWAEGHERECQGLAAISGVVNLLDGGQ